MRNVTERPEVVEAGVAKLVGNQQDNIVTAAKELLYNQNLYNSMTGKQSLFGSGYASEKIVTLIEEILRNNST